MLQIKLLQMNISENLYEDLRQYISNSKVI